MEKFSTYVPPSYLIDSNRTHRPSREVQVLQEIPRFTNLIFNLMKNSNTE